MGSFHSTIRIGEEDYSKTLISILLRIARPFLKSVPSPIDHSCGHISETRTLSGFKSKRIFSRISSCVDSKSRLFREARFRSYDLNRGEKMGNCVGIPINKVSHGATKCFDFLGRDKRYAATEVDDADREKEDVVYECFVHLTEEEEDFVDHALSNSNRMHILVSHDNSNIDITGETLQCLKPATWLNDEVINLYLELLKERENREPQKFLKCHFFNSFFYEKLISRRDGYNFQAVRRWTTQRKIGYSLLDCEKIFVPIHKGGSHWCLAIINKKDKKFQYLDSLKGVDGQVIDVLERYYADEAKDKTGKDMDVDSWEKEFVIDLPKQENLEDCGMFMIKYIDFHSRDIGLCFDQTHMPYFRRRTAKEILKLRAE